MFYTLDGGGFDPDFDRFLPVHTGKLTAAGGGLGFDPEGNGLIVKGVEHGGALVIQSGAGTSVPFRRAEALPLKLEKNLPI